MFFSLSKVFWFMFEPANLVYLCLLAGTVLLWTRWTVAARKLLTAVSVMVLVVAVLPVGNMVTQALENRFPIPELPQKIAGIVILGGVIDPFVSSARGITAVGSAAERLIEGAALARRFPAAPIIFSGGSGRLTDQSKREADYVLPLLRSLGVDQSRVILDENARNTHENALNARDLVKDVAALPWVLVTSAFHMPRAIGTFRQAGWNVLAYPVDFETLPRDGITLTFSLRGNIGNLSHAMHEIIGLLAYWLTGRSDSAYPGP